MVGDPFCLLVDMLMVVCCIGKERLGNVGYYAELMLQLVVPKNIHRALRD